MSYEKLELNISKLKRFFSMVKPIIAVYIFGSTARGRDKTGSDIDFAILLEENFNYRKNFDLKLDLINRLSDITRTQVDIVFLNRADIILQHQIRKYARLLYERDKMKRILYEVNFRKRYFDFLPRHRIYMESLIKSMFR